MIKMERKEKVDELNHKQGEAFDPKCNPGPEVKPKTSKAAITSLVLGLGWIFLGPLFPLAGGAGFIFGVVGIVGIRKSKGRLRGLGIAIMGLILSSLSVLAISALIFKIATCGTLYSQDPKQILMDGRLAGLPASATNVKAEGWSGIFTGEDYLMFQADPKEINRFIAGSVSLKGQKPQVFSPEKMYVPMDSDGEHKTGYTMEGEPKHEYFFTDKYSPKWYDPTIRVRGRKYEIPSEKMHNWGSVIVNDQTNTVYIWVIWS